MIAIRPIFQSFKNRLGTARLSRVGTLEAQAGDYVLNLDVYPTFNPEDPSDIIILPEPGLLAVSRDREEAARAEGDTASAPPKEKKARPIEVRAIYLHFIARTGNDGLVKCGAIERFANGSGIIHLDAIPSRAPDSGQSNAFRLIAPAGGNEPRPAAANMATPTGAQGITEEQVALARRVGG